MDELGDVGLDKTDLFVCVFPIGLDELVHECHLVTLLLKLRLQLWLFTLIRPYKRVHLVLEHLGQRLRTVRITVAAV